MRKKHALCSDRINKSLTFFWSKDYLELCHSYTVFILFFVLFFVFVYSKEDVADNEDRLVKVRWGQVIGEIRWGQVLDCVEFDELRLV